MTKADLLALAARCESAIANMQASLIEEAWWAVNRNYADDRSLRELIDAEAYLDAAMTLKRKTWEWSYNSVWGTAQVWAGNGAAVIKGKGSSPALALTATFLRAIAEEVSDV